MNVALTIGNGSINRGGCPMKRLILGAVIVVGIINACARMGGALSSNSPSQSATLNAAIIPAGKIIVIQLDTPMNTCFTKKGENIEFHTVADIVVDNQILIPGNSLVHCQVKKSKGARTMGKRAEIQLRLTDVKLPDGTILPFQAAIVRAGTDAVRDSTLLGEAGKGGGVTPIMNGGMQGAMQGMFLGILSGNWEMMLYGAVAGAAFPAVGTMLQRGSELDVPASTLFEARFEKPLQVPAPSVIVQNKPAAVSTAKTEAATANIIVGEPTATTRIEPVPNNPQIGKPIGTASVSKPQPDAILLPANIFMEETWRKSPADLKLPDSGPTSEVASILKPEPGPIASLPEPREGATSVVPADKAYNVSVKVKMVQVDAVVRDRSGRIMPSLGMKDFRVYDNNVLQELAGFSQDKIPLSVAIVVDQSGSVTPYIGQLRYIASRALSNLKEQDEVCLFAFDQNVQMMEGLTADRQRIAFAIGRIGGGGSTNILDALYAASSYLVKTAPNRRHAVILISDNQQTVWSKASEPDIIKIAQEKDIVLYSLMTGASFLPSGNPLRSILPLMTSLPSMFPSGNPPTSADPVGKVANDSGGEVIPVASVESLDGALNTVISRLKTSYSFGYYPPGGQSGTFHTITVRLAEKFGKSGSDYSVQAKKGYYAVQSSDQ
jgi:VWFA-related protein